MECPSLERIRTSDAPPGTTSYVRIRSKRPITMFPSSSPSPSPSPAHSLRPHRHSKQSRPTSPANPELAGEPVGLSDVACYTCRRRHVRCDQSLPTCAKCAKKGVPCLGYQKPLRWADGVAVRGKLKGKSQPVVDNNALKIAQNTVKSSSVSAANDAAHAESNVFQQPPTDVVDNESTFQRLVSYHNARICAEQVTSEQSRFVEQSIVQLSPQVVQKLPRPVLDCILGNAAVHMASRAPGNQPIEHLALETKVNVFQSFNRLLQSPQNSSPDLIIACGLLIFALDLFEHGLSRWRLHFLGTSQIISSLGGIEDLYSHYRHLQLPLTHITHIETFWIVLSHHSFLKPKKVSRQAIDMFFQASLTKRNFFNPCPRTLTLSMWDIGDCASRLLGSRGNIKADDSLRREEILRQILAFNPEDGAREIREAYYKVSVMSERSFYHWTMIYSIWKGAVVILCLRYLYLGRPRLTPPSHTSPPSLRTPAPQKIASVDPQQELDSYFSYFEESSFSDTFGDSSDHDSLPGHLSPGMPLTIDADSRSPSPFPSPFAHSASYQAPTIWNERHGLHNEAFVSLTQSATAMFNDVDPIFIRYMMTPLIILALVSRPGSAERNLCLAYFSRYTDYMRANCPPETPYSPNLKLDQLPPNSQGGSELTFDIPWQKLDAFSAKVENERADSFPQESNDGLTISAPEWNWGDMLSHVKLELIWPITAGTSHCERGTEFWAFNLISSIVNQDCVDVWTK